MPDTSNRAGLLTADERHQEWLAADAEALLEVKTVALADLMGFVPHNLLLSRYLLHSCVLNLSSRLRADVCVATSVGKTI